MQEKFTLEPNTEKSQPGKFHLFRSDIIQICPLRNPIPAQTQIGATILFHIPCGDHCPHFHNRGDDVLMTCGEGNIIPLTNS